MGYGTRYHLDVNFVVNNIPVKLEDDTPLLSVIEELRQENEEAKYALEPDGGGSNSDARWYEHKADLTAFSAKHPGVLFTLHGEGEENDDIWTEYFLNGKVQVARATVQIAPFNPAELK